MQNNLKKLAFTCIQDKGILQKTKAGTTYCSMLPLEGRAFPCPYSGGLIDTGEAFERYRCFYQKGALEFWSEGRSGGAALLRAESHLEVYSGGLVQVSLSRDDWSHSFRRVNVLKRLRNPKEGVS
ncbi:MAG: hypothetical protein A3F84_05615 [Candidatus Handelsmanbacteria bacterium RIFCSPLOWO2_12_FULL_64_10]|uniref:Uncharacterized protein n=1 Tax=Handelsmanbacteria sp. (strain RIFCSPLOWO2_12_FULL_64_10) TaxID=1817868 RepID=A0A1F6C6P9_HANXR|nr:MAG: hypothetical protein A3F84_05615 [Candidatus Handelsmanbacteria bacterium RIFCSPLOWO2_12_FULL_64_10]